MTGGGRRRLSGRRCALIPCVLPPCVPHPPPPHRPFQEEALEFPDSDVEVEQEEERRALKRKAQEDLMAEQRSAVPARAALAIGNPATMLGAMSEGSRKKRMRKSAGVFPADTTGATILPVIAGRGQNEVEIVALGTIVPDRDGFHTPRHIFPKGFTSRKTYFSFVHAGKKTVYTNRIVDIGLRDPVFEVSAEDAKGQLFTGASASGMCLTRGVLLLLLLSWYCCTLLQAAPGLIADSS